jgi:Tol biopolymer transport system component
VSFDISPDGNWLAVLKEADRESCDLWLVHADSKQQIFVPTMHHNMTDVVFSHTESLAIFYAAGGSIYRTRPHENECELVAELRNQWQRWFELTPEDSVVCVDYVPKPAVHPNGRYVAFPIVIDYYTECAFVLMDLENGTSDTLEARTYLKSTAAFPEWWFDGTSLVFTGHRILGGCPNASMQEGEIWLLKNALPE